jgi:hypothetical protein
MSGRYGSGWMSVPFFVEEVVDQWYGPSDVFFKVRADDGNFYILRQSSSASEEAWSLEAFREMKG